MTSKLGRSSPTLSPSNSASEVLEKLDDYFAAGCRLVWVIYPESAKLYAYTSSTSVRILTPADELDGGEVVPGFRLPLAALLESPTAPE